MNILEKPIYDLLQTEPYYAHFLLNCKLIYDHLKVPRAGVRIRNYTLEFVINTAWFSGIPASEQVAVLKHEVMHVVLEHCGARVRGNYKGIPHTNLNIAMDCAINQYIKDLPNDCVTLASLSKQLDKTLPEFQNWEYYLGEIQEFVQENPDKCMPGNPDEHEYMLDGDEGGKMSKEQMRAAIKDISEKAKKAAKGKLPDSIKDLIGNLTDKACVDWKQQLRNIVASVKSPAKKNTRSKPNRRYGLDQPGKKRTKTLVLGVCCDSSGSVSDESYAMFMREIKTIAKSTALTYLVHADCAVHKVDLIKNGKAAGNVLSSRHGRGGTAYQPAIDYCVAQGCDAIIYFGDMDSADTPLNPKLPFIWARVGDQSPPGDFGKIVEVK